MEEVRQDFLENVLAKKAEPSTPETQSVLSKSPSISTIREKIEDNKEVLEKID